MKRTNCIVASKGTIVPATPAALATEIREARQWEGVGRHRCGGRVMFLTRGYSGGGFVGSYDIPAPQEPLANLASAVAAASVALYDRDECRIADELDTALCHYRQTL